GPVLVDAAHGVKDDDEPFRRRFARRSCFAQAKQRVEPGRGAHASHEGATAESIRHHGWPPWARVRVRIAADAATARAIAGMVLPDRDVRATTSSTSQLSAVRGAFIA